MDYPDFSALMGQAVTAIILLSDYDKYDLSERVCYHFDLTEALTAERTLTEDATAAPADDRPVLQFQESACGVASLLECVPTTPWHRLTRKQKRALKTAIQTFNIQASAVRQDPSVYCHQPPQLPLRLNPSTRVYFAYETTRIAFCLDASPTLTSTFGFSSGANDSENDSACCPMDRLADMVRTFFASLVEPEQVPATTNKGVWRPCLAVTVLAVYPRGTGTSHRTSLLVRDFRVTDADSADLLSSKIGQWALSEVETEIARRLSGGSGMGNVPGASYDAWTVPMYSSSLRDLLDAGDTALSTLSSAARPCVVIATDGRSVACDGIIDVLSDKDRVDIPLIVLDLSSPSSHDMASSVQPEKGVGDNYFQVVNYDPIGAMFPLHLSDDTEALYAICKATAGCFFDQKLLEVAAKTSAGQVSPESPLSADQFFTFKGHTFRPNAVQWYTLFSLSPLSETSHSTWGTLPPPEYILRRLGLSGKNELATTVPSHLERRPSLLSTRTKMSSGSIDTSRAYAPSESSQVLRKAQVRSTFSTYTMNPVRIKVLLLMRVREGYRSKQYGQSTNDPDKVFIHFTLQLENASTLHYELSYRGLSNYNYMLGSAHVKIQLSGEASFIQAVKHDFLHQGHRVRTFTMAQQVSARLCTMLRWIRKEDAQQSYLTPLKWSDQLTNPNTPFVKRLQLLTPLQRKHHFRAGEFDCVCLHRFPYAPEEFLKEFRDDDDGEEELIAEVSKWSTQTIEEGRRYVRQIQASDSGIATYCVVELVRSAVASSVFSVSVETFGGTEAKDRLALIASLKRLLGKLKSVEVLSKQMGKFLVGVRMRQARHPVSGKERLLESHHNHATWDLIKDPELLPLLMKRRIEIGNFLVLDSSDNHALFAKLVREDMGPVESNDPGDLVQYQLAILSGRRVVVDLHMESESGEFFPFRPIQDDLVRQSKSKFHKMVRTLKKRDQECGRALRCRTTLLRVLSEEIPVTNSPEESQLFCVEKLLPYASSATLRLRFFHTGCGAANSILQSLTGQLLLSGTSTAKVARLPIDADADIGELGPGDWFLVEFDRQTISFVHLAGNEKNNVPQTDGQDFAYRELSFLTIGISDLYSRRDDIADDDSSNDHISEYLCVSELSDLIKGAHNENYSSAAYAALKWDSLPAFEYFHSDDYAEIMRPLEYVEVAKVLIAGAGAACEGGVSKLLHLIQTVLQPVRDDKYCFFYTGTVSNERFLPLDDVSDTGGSFDGASGELSVDNDEFTIRSLESVHSQTHANDKDSLQHSLQGSLETSPPSGRIAAAPIFMRFSLNNVPASIDDLAGNINKSSGLSALVSTFRDSELSNSQRELRKADLSQLPISHLNPANELSLLLNAYVAEQTLERLRHHGIAIEEADLRLAKACLRKARGVVTSAVDVFFYIRQKDSMVPASASTGADLEIEEGFKLVLNELQKHSADHLKPYGENGFLFTEAESDDDLLPYWCFVSIRKLRGISVEVHHPAGTDRASLVMANVHVLISMCCHRVNQMLLLRHLHRNRTASALLIAPETEMSVAIIESSPDEDVGPFHPGLFGCPIVFRTSFDLFHRCATNPAHVARSLEATVLQIFAVSNRRHVFVYKDETGGIFYMSLLTTGGGVETDGTIELLVHGVYEPGPSVTRQLKRLLQKRLMIIAIDMLSSVLTKNPHYNWRDADFAFVRSFEAEWQSVVEDEKSPGCAESERFYDFPTEVFDPGMVLLYFRQNICGSTYFHRLQGTENDNRAGKTFSGQKECDSVEDDTTEKPVAVSEDSRLFIDWTNFAFYYNNAPSKLDPKLQAQSTLTLRGRQLSRAAGTGIAMIELSLVGEDGMEVSEMNLAIPPTETDSALDIPMGAYRFLESKSPHRKYTETDRPRHRLCIKITDTALNRDVLHEWILLTLNQVLVAWTIERHVEREQCGLLRLGPDIAAMPLTTELGRTLVVDQLCPGLPALTAVLQTSHELPHPAILKLENEGNIRSSAVATVALKLLDDTLLSQLRAETRGKLELDVSSDFCVIRLSRSERPRRVNLSWETSRHEKAVVHAVSDSGERSEVIQDAPIDCPEYICFYRFAEYSRIEGEDGVSPPKLFEHVVVDDGTGYDSLLLSSLEALKKRQPRPFFRSFVFVFSIKRKRRKLLTYNWSPQLFKSVASRLTEEDKTFLISTGRSTDLLQRHSLQLLSPKTDAKEEKPRIGSIERSGSGSLGLNVAPRRFANAESSAASLPEPFDPASVASQKDRDRGPLRPAPVRRIARPTIMRRPKLIGKSVEGAAMHAVAASRARAKSNAFKGSSTGGSATAPSPKGQHTESKPAAPSTPTKQSSKTTRPVRGRETLATTVQDDKQLGRVRKDLNSLSQVGVGSLIREHTIQAEAVRSVTMLWWSIKRKQSMPLSVADFILSHCSQVWSDASELLRLPTTVLKSFPISFGQALSAWTPGLRLMTLTPNNSDPTVSLQGSPVLLMGAIRSVRNCKCFGIVKVSTVTRRIAGKRKTMVTCGGWVLTLPRRTKKSDDIRQKTGPMSNARLTLERDATGMDKLATDLRKTLPLESMVFDYVAWVVERALKSVDGKLEYSEAHQLVRELITSHSLVRQLRVMKSNYKAFETNIILKSYRNRLIDMHEGPLLFQWLVSHSKERNVILTGPGGLCFKREVIVQGTQSICFLTCDGSVKDKMKIQILSRTQGRNLRDFMFREGSDVAISIADNIAVEAAGLAFEEFRAASASLYRDALWSRVSLSSPVRKSVDVPIGEEIDELLQLTMVTPIEQYVRNKTDFQQLALALDGELGTFCDVLAKEPSFSPAWELMNDNAQRARRLFYMSSEDIFLLAKLSASGTVQFSLVEREHGALVGPGSGAVTQKLTNFLLHYFWSECH